jgi:hypothetical protein
MEDMEQLNLDPTDALLRRIARDALVIAQLEALVDHLQAENQRLAETKVAVEDGVTDGE